MLAPFALGALSASLVSLPPREAKASRDEETFFAVMFTALGLADLMFTSYDAAKAKNGELPSTKWAVAELVVSLPQTATLGGVTAAFTIDRETEVSVVAFPFSVFPGALTVHGLWSLTSRDVDAKTLFWASPAIAADTVLTAAALTAMFGKRRVFTQEMGVAAVVATLPQVIAGTYKLGLDDSFKPGWAAFTGWSSALLIHGAVSIALDRGRSYNGASPSRLASVVGGAYRPHVQLDSIAPGPVGGSVERAPGYGLVMSGSF